MATGVKREREREKVEVRPLEWVKWLLSNYKESASLEPGERMSAVSN